MRDTEQALREAWGDRSDTEEMIDEWRSASPQGRAEIEDLLLVYGLDRFHAQVDAFEQRIRNQ